MRSVWGGILALPVLVIAAQAADEYVTVPHRFMCTTQQSLREILRAIEAKDRDTMRTVQGCRYSVDGAHAEVLQDNVSMIKIRLGLPEQENRPEYWTLPDTVKPVRR